MHSVLRPPTSLLPRPARCCPRFQRRPDGLSSINTPPSVRQHRHQDVRLNSKSGSESASSRDFGFGDDKRREVEALHRQVSSSADAVLAGDSDSATAPKAILDTSTGWKQRWTILALCFVAFMLCNMDRVNMSIAILPMSQQFGWSSATMGIVQSSFFWGYLCTQVLGGIAADRLGGKLVLGLGVVWWSIATMLTPIAAQHSLPLLLACRALMGIGEGVAMPAMNNLLSRWIPSQERSRSLALVYSGMYVGSMLGLGLSPSMIGAYGWPSVFFIFGSLGVAWYSVWSMRASSTPNEDPRISEGEKAYIVANAVSKSNVDAIPWKKLLSRKEVWAIIISHFCHNWGVFILLTWMPSYYSTVLGFDLAHAGLAAVYPWLCMAVMANVGGWIADTAVAKGYSRSSVRKTMQTIGFMGPAFCLTQLQSITDPMSAVLCMCACQGLDAFSQSGLYSNHQDIGPKYAGVLLGMSNTAGVLAGVLSTAATGYILEVGTWNDVWSSAIFLYVLGTIVWNLFSTGDQIFD